MIRFYIIAAYIILAVRVFASPLLNGFFGEYYGSPQQQIGSGWTPNDVSPPEVAPRFWLSTSTRVTGPYSTYPTADTLGTWNNQTPYYFPTQTSGSNNDWAQYTSGYFVAITNNVYASTAPSTANRGLDFGMYSTVPARLQKAPFLYYTTNPSYSNTEFGVIGTTNRFYWMALVGKINKLDDGASFYPLVSHNNNGWYLSVYWDGRVLFKWGGWQCNTLSPILAEGDPFILVVRAKYGTGGHIQDIWLNGSLKYAQTNGTAFGGFAPNTAGYRIGRSNNTKTNMSIIVSEVIGGHSTSLAFISDATREKVEGWAAYEYGLQSLLPTNHPYKSSPP